MVRSCGAAEPAYDPETGTVDFCAEHVDEIRDRFAHADRRGGSGWQRLLAGHLKRQV